MWAGRPNSYIVPDSDVDKEFDLCICSWGLFNGLSLTIKRDFNTIYTCSPDLNNLGVLKICKCKQIVNNCFKHYFVRKRHGYYVYSLLISLMYSFKYSYERYPEANFFSDCFIVGGFIRDILSGRDYRDIDLKYVLGTRIDSFTGEE